MRWPGFRKVRGTLCKRVRRRLLEFDLTDLAQYRAYPERNPREWAVLDASIRSGFQADIQFSVQDIRTTFPSGSYHVIFCRNLVFNYFSETLQHQLLKRMISALRPDGVLILGRHEKLPDFSGSFLPCGENLGVYQLIEGRQV